MAIVTLNKLTREFSDLDMNFLIHPVKGDLNLLKNERAIINAIKNIILTNHYEKPFFPDYGSNVRRLLFENFDVTTTAALENEIRQCIENFEPRIQVLSVIVKNNYDNNSFDVTMQFSIVNISEPIIINFILQRVR